MQRKKKARVRQHALDIRGAVCRWACGGDHLAGLGGRCGFCCTMCRHTADDGTDEPALLSMNLELPESGAEMKVMQEMQEMTGGGSG